MQFIELMKKKEAFGDETPIENAIKYCIEHNILSDFLGRRKEEVLKAMEIDMTFERREQLIRRDERLEGALSARIEDIKNLVNNLSLSVDEAMNALSIEGPEREEVLKRL